MEAKVDVEVMQYAQNMIQTKGFNEYTASRVLDYIDSHDKLYGEIISTKDVIDRLSQNLLHDIEFDFEHVGFAKGEYRTNS